MTISEEQLLWLELSLVPELQPRNIPGLAAAFESVGEIFSADHMTLASRGGIKAGVATGITTRAAKDKAEEELALLRKNDIKLLTWGCQAYPPLLRRITDPPPVLYYLGQLMPFNEINVAIVGTRHPSAYGSQVAHRLAGDLAGYGVTVVSGMAYGIDQAAHNGALANDGRTIAVLGGGFGNIYPSRSDKLVKRISSQGAVISEFPYHVHPAKGNFPMRNRIVSGMCYASVVIEAREKSGALITARLALEQNRELLAVPGPIYSKTSLGPNYLIKSGAKLIQRSEDIIDELPREIKDKLCTAANRTENVKLTEQENKVMEILSVDTPRHIDIIAAHLETSTSELSLVLLEMEMKSLVKQLPGMEYLKAI